MAEIKTQPVTAAYEEGFDRAFSGPRDTRKGLFVMRCSKCDGAEHDACARLYMCPRCREWTYASMPAGEAPPLQEQSRAVDAPIMVDRFYENTVAQDGTDIGSRAKHREYMKRHGLTTVDDYTETWKRAEVERKRVLSGEADRKERREVLGRAMYELEKAKNARRR